MRTLPVPAGWRLRPSAGLRRVASRGVLLGGLPLRVLTLTTAGAELVHGWWAGRPVGEGSGERRLARRLLDAGLADPEPPEVPRHDDVTIVVPVRDRPAQLRACLAGLRSPAQVLVVDDGSLRPRAIATIADQFGARYVRRDRNGGPAAARNTGLALATSPLVAFLDSDCVPSPAFPDDLVRHLGDPAVAAVAPRIVSTTTNRGRVAAYERCRSALDMGPHPALVRPHGPVSYVPSAALLARREALGAGFDEALQMGEEVDLIWRLHDAGWQTRYEPRASVAHEHRTRLRSWYARRVLYNASVGPLARRHPDRLATLHLSRAAAVCWAATLGGFPAALPALAAARALRLWQMLAGRVPRAGILAAGLGFEVTVREGRELARALAGPWCPLVLGAALSSRGRAWALRAAGLVAAWTLLELRRDEPDLDPVSYVALRIAEENARGAGTWLGCLRERRFQPLLPARRGRHDALDWANPNASRR